MADSQVADLLDFWFDPTADRKRWFVSSTAFDDTLRERFGSLMEHARVACSHMDRQTATDDRSQKMQGWIKEPRGALAMILLLDQLPRNLFRGSPAAYSSDPLARHVAALTMANGLDLQLEPVQQMFVYLPFMHDETLPGQLLARHLYKDYVQRCVQDSDLAELSKQALGMSQRHLDVVMKFGRFPARNAALGRASTAEEESFLAAHAMGF